MDIEKIKNGEKKDLIGASLRDAKYGNTEGAGTIRKRKGENEMKKDEMCNWDCDEMHCSVCQLGVDTNNVQGLHAIEMATIKYRVARYKLDRAKNTCLEIEELLEQARKNLCDMLGDYTKAEKEYREAMKEKYSDLDKANFLEWYNNAGAEEIATAMRHNKGQLEYLKRKYIPDGRIVNDQDI